jgi:AhpD family alkylhydroperoxidase
MSSIKSSRLFVPFAAGTLALALALPSRTARAEDPSVAAAKADMIKTVGFVPTFLKDVPDNLVPGFWQETKAIEFGKTALDGKTRDLIGLAIAAQMPSRLTAWSYTKCGKSSGATDAQLHEAVALSALTRHWSTFFNGVQLDETRYRADLAKLRENMTKAMASGAKPPAPMPITDAASVYRDVEASFGFVPDFMRRFPPEALPGAWLAFRDFEGNPATAIPGKVKSLIGIAVAAQIPCRYCVISDTEFAKLEGATDREITEAVTIGAMARQYITLVEGLQVDEKAYRRDWERLTASPAKSGAKSAANAAVKGTHIAKSE